MKKKTKSGGLAKRIPLEHKQESFGDIFAIDPNNLEGESLRQVELMSKYSELSAEAEFQVLKYEERKKTFRSQCIEDIEAGVEVLPGSKNAPSCEAHYRTRPKYKEIVEHLNEAIYRRDLMRNAMSTLFHRKEILEIFNRRQIALNSVQSPMAEKEQRRELANIKVKLRRKQ